MLRKLTRHVLLAVLLCSLFPVENLIAQDLQPRNAPTLTLVNPGIVTAVRGKSENVEIEFRVPAGFHVNSNKPHSEFLIPTTLKMTAPTDIVIGGVNYPPGEDASFPFAPTDKLSVYGRQFSISFGIRPLSTVIPGNYAVRGNLKYQACDNATCYPPKLLPVNFQIKVVKSTVESKGTKNPAQSPHAHR
jgi:cytochrome c biogenesis DsbD-like protein